MIPEALQTLIGHFERYPGVGPRQAERFVFFLLKQPPAEIQRALSALKALSTELAMCSLCNMPTKRDKHLICETCADPKRDAAMLAVVEKESDVLNMEKINIFKGRYFVLGENISPIHKSKFAKDRVKKLMRHVRAHKQTGKLELILALNNTREGNFTSLYIQEVLKNIAHSGIRVTRLGRGLATGSELEYADAETLKSALEGRQ